MGIDINALTTNADKLKKCIDENEKQEQDRKEKDEQLSRAIERKVTKKEHKREKPRGRDSAIKECIRLLKEGANPKVLTELEKMLREQEGNYKYYVECFLPVLDRKIKQSDGVSTEIKGQVRQVISNITNNSIICSQVEDNNKVETSNGVANTSAQLLKAIEKGNNSKFKKYLKKCTDISNIKNEEGKNILHLIASLEGKLKLKFLGTLIKTVTKENLRQLIDGENHGKTPLQEALINKITKGKHESHTIGSNDNTLKFVVALLKQGTKPDQLELSQQILQSLDEKRNSYYHKFLKKLEGSVGKSQLSQEIKSPIIIKTAKITASGFPLHKAILDKDIDRFKKLLQHTCNVSTETGLINAPNNDQLTSLHLLLQHIQEESREPSLKNIFKKEFKNTLGILLKNGADITAEDKERNNALHYIASFKGEQKVACLNLILGLVEGRKIPVDQLSKAINAPNGEKDTPLRLALKKKAKKESIEYLSQETVFDPAINYDNTTKFCARLLQNGANSGSLWLKDPEFHTKKYYLALRDLKDYSSTPHEAREKAREMKKYLEKKYNIKTLPGQLLNTAHGIGSGLKKGLSNAGKALSAIGKYMDPASRTRELLTIIITTTVVAMAAFAFFQGQIGVGAAVSMIAIAGVICLTLTLGFNGIKKLFGDSADKVKNFVDNDQQNLGNDFTDLAAKKQQSQSKDTESPNSKVQVKSVDHHNKSCDLLAI